MVVKNNSSSPESDSGVGISETAEVFSGMLSGKGFVSGKSLDEPKEGSEEPTESEVEELESMEEGDEESAEIQESEEPEEEEQDASEEDSEEVQTKSNEPNAIELPDDANVKVAINGEIVAVNGKELREGYMRTRDYTQKTQVLSEERKANQAETDAVRNERGVYAKILPVLIKQLDEQENPNIDMDKLYQEDPIEWTRVNELRRQRQEKRQLFAQEQQRLVFEDERTKKIEFERYVKDEGDKLIKAVPEWKDEKVWGKEAAQIRKYATSIGFTDDEVDKAFDHRTIRAFRDAAKYREITSNKPKPVPGKSPRVAGPSSTINTLRPVSPLDKSLKNLAKSGKISDATEVFANLLSKRK